MFKSVLKVRRIRRGEGFGSERAPQERRGNVLVRVEWFIFLKSFLF